MLTVLFRCEYVQLIDGDLASYAWTTQLYDADGGNAFSACCEIPTEADGVKFFFRQMAGVDEIANALFTIG